MSRRPRLTLFAVAVGVLALLGSGCAVLDSARERLPGPAASPSAAAPDGSTEAPSVAPTPPPLPGRPLQAVSVLTLHFEGLRPLQAGHYEGWALIGSERVSTGKFRVTADRTLVALNGTAVSAFPLARDIAEASQISVTIEPEGDRDATPSGVVILNGALVGGRARLSFPAALEELAGGFILASPTDADLTNEVAGIWFTDTTATRAGLELPELPPGWTFEGWTGTQGLSFSMGRFVRPTGPDFATPFSGPRPGYRFPGEDFVARLPGTVRPPVNLADGASTIAVTIEPDLGGQDPSGGGPFWLLPLRRAVEANTPTGVQQRLDLDMSVVPSGVATVG